MSDQEDPYKGYRGIAKGRLKKWGVRVWSDVRVVNVAGSVFEGVILPRSGNFDDLHIVLKQKTGYNVAPDPDLEIKLEEYRWLERSIGPTGRLALKPLRRADARTDWERHLLGRPGQALD